MPGRTSKPALREGDDLDGRTGRASPRASPSRPRCRRGRTRYRRRHGCGYACCRARPRARPGAPTAAGVGIGRLCLSARSFSILSIRRGPTSFLYQDMPEQRLVEMRVRLDQAGQQQASPPLQDRGVVRGRVWPGDPSVAQQDVGRPGAERADVAQQQRGHAALIGASSSASAAPCCPAAAPPTARRRAPPRPSAAGAAA